MPEKIEKKRHRIPSQDGKGILELFPIFQIVEKPEDVSQLSGDTECRWVEVKMVDEKGKEVKLTVNYLDLYMFAYFVASEEVRQSLAARYERNVKMVPYDVSFTLDKEEMAKGTAQRRIEVPVDEITWHIARQEAWQMLSKDIKNNNLNPKNYVKRKK